MAGLLPASDRLESFMRKILLVAVAGAMALSGCSWGIKLNDAGRQVRTAWTGDLSSCRELGKVTVSVMDRVGPVDRNDIKVRDELEVMARNEAATMGADTVKPIGEPADGTQSWGAYRCGSKPVSSAPAGATSGGEAPRDGTAKTYPLKSGGG
jgi:hypothetical protein